MLRGEGEIRQQRRASKALQSASHLVDVVLLVREPGPGCKKVTQTVRSLPLMASRVRHA
jgi:hypothetical protein